MVIGPYYFLTEETKKRLEQQLLTAVTEWRSQWLNREADISLVEVNGNLTLCKDGASYRLQFDDVLVASDDDKLLRELVIGYTCVPTDAEASETFAQLIQRLSNVQFTELLRLLSDENSTSVPEITILSSPYVEAKFSLNGRSFSVYFGSEWMNRNFPQQFRLADLAQTEPLISALSRSSAQIDISAGQIKITYAELARLNVGDVLLSDLGVDDLFSAQHKDKPLFSSFLGQHRGSKAIIVKSIKY